MKLIIPYEVKLMKCDKGLTVAATEEIKIKFFQDPADDGKVKLLKNSIE